MLGRIYFISPRDTKRFSMRLLLLNTAGATSFADLRSVNGTTFNTYQKAAIERGLLDDDKIWCQTLSEATMGNPGKHFSHSRCPLYGISSLVLLLNLCQHQELEEQNPQY